MIIYLHSFATSFAFFPNIFVFLTKNVKKWMTVREALKVNTKVLQENEKILVHTNTSKINNCETSLKECIHLQGAMKFGHSSRRKRSSSQMTLFQSDNKLIHPSSGHCTNLWSVMIHSCLNWLGLGRTTLCGYQMKLDAHLKVLNA